MLISLCARRGRHAVELTALMFFAMGVCRFAATGEAETSDTEQEERKPEVRTDDEVFRDFIDHQTDVLKRLLLIIHQCPNPDLPNAYDPTAAVRVANALIPYDQVQVEIALSLYAKLKNYGSYLARTGKISRSSDMELEQVMLLMSLLFVPDGDVNTLPVWNAVGLADYKSARKQWPQYPVLVVDDWPFLISQGGGTTGPRLNPGVSLPEWLVRCKMRQEPYHPKGSPLAAAERILRSPEWQHFFTVDARASQETQELRNQALRAVAPAYPTPINPLFVRPSPQIEEAWKLHLERVGALHVRWDEAKGKVVAGIPFGAPSTSPAASDRRDLIEKPRNAKEEK